MDIDSTWHASLFSLEDEKDETTLQYAIVTTEAIPGMEQIHDRMPVIISEPNHIETWLNPEHPWNDAMDELLVSARSILKKKANSICFIL